MADPAYRAMAQVKAAHEAFERRRTSASDPATGEELEEAQRERGLSWWKHLNLEELQVVCRPLGVLHLSVTDLDLRDQEKVYDAFQREMEAHDHRDWLISYPGPVPQQKHRAATDIPSPNE